MGRRLTDRETVADIQESIDCLTQRKMLPKRERRKSPRVGDIPGKVFKTWFARAYVHGGYGLSSKSDKRRPSYTALARFFAERGRKGMRAALLNYHSKDVDRPHEVPRTKDFESLVRERKEFFPSFEADKIFLRA